MLCTVRLRKPLGNNKKNKIEATQILNLAIVKKLKVKKFVENLLKICQKFVKKEFVKKFIKKFVKKIVKQVYIPQ